MSVYQLEGLAALAVGIALLFGRRAAVPRLRQFMAAFGFSAPAGTQADSLWHRFLRAWPGIVVMVVGIGWTVLGALALLTG